MLIVHFFIGDAKTDRLVSFKFSSILVVIAGVISVLSLDGTWKFSKISNTLSLTLLPEVEKKKILTR